MRTNWETGKPFASACGRARGAGESDGVGASDVPGGGSGSRDAAVSGQDGGRRRAIDGGDADAGGPASAVWISADLGDAAKGRLASESQACLSIVEKAGIKSAEQTAQETPRGIR